MTRQPEVVVDSREQDETIKAGADRRQLLEYDGPDGQKFSVDFEVCMRTGQVLRFERKAGDLVSSWQAGSLERQVSAVDALIVEVGIDDMITPRDPDSFENAMLHLATLAMNVPVIHSFGPEHTVRILHHFKNRTEGLVIRQNKLASSAPNLRWRILEAMTGINPYRPLGNGFRLGDQLEAIIDWRKLADALKLDQWRDGISWGIGRPIPAATLGKISKDLANGDGATHGEPVLSQRTPA